MGLFFRGHPQRDPEPGCQKHAWAQLLSQRQVPVIKLHAETEVVERKTRRRSCRGTMMKMKHWTKRHAALTTAPIAEIPEQCHDSWGAAPQASGGQVTLEGGGSFSMHRKAWEQPSRAGLQSRQERWAKIEMPKSKPSRGRCIA